MTRIYHLDCVNNMTSYIQTYSSIRVKASIKNKDNNFRFLRNLVSVLTHIRRGTCSYLATNMKKKILKDEQLMNAWKV